MGKRDSRIDNAKGVLIILVVIGHFLLPVASTRFTTNSLYLIYTFHMPCFIFISGYLAKGVYRDGKFRFDKLARLIWLYILFEVGVHITEGLLEGSIGWKIDFFHESGAPWYLLALILWYLLIPVFFHLKKWVSLAAVLAIGLAGGYAGNLGDFLAADRVLAFAPSGGGGPRWERGLFQAPWSFWEPMIIWNLTAWQFTAPCMTGLLRSFIRCAG